MNYELEVLGDYRLFGMHVRHSSAFIQCIFGTNGGALRVPRYVILPWCAAAIELWFVHAGLYYFHLGGDSTNSTRDDTRQVLGVSPTSSYPTGSYDVIF